MWNNVGCLDGDPFLEELLLIGSKRTFEGVFQKIKFYTNGTSGFLPMASFQACYFSLLFRVARVMWHESFQAGPLQAKKSASKLHTFISS